MRADRDLGSVSSPTLQRGPLVGTGRRRATPRGRVFIRYPMARGRGVWSRSSSPNACLHYALSVSHLAPCSLSDRVYGSRPALRASVTRRRRSDVRDHHIQGALSAVLLPTRSPTMPTRRRRIVARCLPPVRTRSDTRRTALDRQSPRPTPCATFTPSKAAVSDRAP